MITLEANRGEFLAVLRNNFSAFLERSFYELNPQATFSSNWHIDVIAQELEKCRSGELKRLIINVPPRSLKSQCASVAFVAWLLGQDPTAKIICASYAQDLSNKHAMDTKAIVERDWYQELFPKTRLSPQRQAIAEFMTTQRGMRLATSVGGVLTGRGSDYIIIDDPLKPDEALSETQRNSVNAWYDNTLYSRLDDKQKGVIILIMQRLHEDDLVGHVLEQEKWKVLRFPAIAEEEEQHTVQFSGREVIYTRKPGEALHPERESLRVLEKIRSTVGEYNFAGQYQQAPTPAGGGMVKQTWFKTYRTTELPQNFSFIFQSWDTANKSSELSDYSVCTTWGVVKKDLYLLHVLRKRLDYPELKRAVRAQDETFLPKTILIEDKASGTQLIQDLIAEGVHKIKKYQPKLDKVMRMHSVTSTIENGFVYLPEKAEWLNLYMHEMTTFPNGKHDDQADSTSQALDWARMGVNPPWWITIYGDEVRENYIRQGRWEELKKLEEKYSFAGK